MWARSAATGLRLRSRRRTVTVNRSNSTSPTTHSITTGGTASGRRCVRSIVNQATAKPSTRLPASPMNVRQRPRQGCGAFNNRKPITAPSSATINVSDSASPNQKAKAAK